MEMRTIEVPAGGSEQFLRRSDRYRSVVVIFGNNASAGWAVGIARLRALNDGALVPMPTTTDNYRQVSFLLEPNYELWTFNGGAGADVASVIATDMPDPWKARSP